MSELSKKLVAFAVILAAVFAVYSNSFQGAFVYDDFINIVNNPALKTLSSAISHTSRPLTNLTFFLQYRAGLTREADFHMVSVILHALNAALLGMLISRICTHPATGRRLVFSTAVSLLWAVHPIHTESVSYIVQRSELLSVTFILLGLIAGLRYLRERTKGAIAATMLAFTMAYVSKPTAVSAPFLLLLVAAFVHPGGVLESLRKSRGLYIAAFLSLIVPAVMLMRPTESTTSAGFNMQVVSFVEYLAFQPRALLVYVGKLLWPARLLIDYGADIEHSLASVAVCLLLLSALIWLIYRIANRDGLARMGLAWFFVSLAPVIFVPLSDLLAEHRVYLASAGIAIIVARGLAGVSRRIGGNYRSSQFVYMAIVGVLVCALGVRTWRRNTEFRDPLRLWEQVVIANPDNVRGYLGVGSELANRGDLVRAEAAFRLAIKVYHGFGCHFMRESFRTDYAYACHNMSSILSAQGREEEARWFKSESRRMVSEFR